MIRNNNKSWDHHETIGAGEEPTGLTTATRFYQMEVNEYDSINNM